VFARFHEGVTFLLASAPHADTFGYSMPPPGLLRLGGKLRACGVDVRLEDLAFRLASGALANRGDLADGCAEHLLAAAPDVLGLSVMGATLPIALLIAERFRAGAPGVPILLGGPGTTGVAEAVLERFPFIDVVVRGEGEVTLPEVLERLAAGRALAGTAGITWRSEDGSVQREEERDAIRDLAELAPYAWELLPPLAEYKAITGEAEGLTPIDSGRGCAYDCSFCTIGRFWSRRSRTLPAQRLADEVLAIKDIEGARNAYLCHDLFAADHAHAMAFTGELIARESDVPWECRARADHLDAELCVRMATAGCYRVLLGIESASPAVRARNNKGMAADADLLGAVAHCTGAGITPILSLILGLPGEGEPELDETLDFCADAVLLGGVNLSLHLVNPQPGCGLGEEFGAQSKPVEGIRPDMAWGAGETPAERSLIAAHSDLFSTWALLPLGDERLRALRQMADELPEILMRYPRTFGLLRKLHGSTRAVWDLLVGDGRSIESFALATRDARIESTLRWEQAIVRAGLREAHGSVEAGPNARPRRACEVLETRFRHDELTPALISGTEPPPPSDTSQHFAVAQGAKGAATYKINADVAHVLRLAEGDRTLAELDPGLGRAMEHLAARGLITFAASP